MDPLQGDPRQSDLPKNQPLQKLQQAVSSAIAGLSPDQSSADQLLTEQLLAEQWSWHPPGKWCVAEVLEHLYLTYTGTIKGCERALAAGKTAADKPRANKPTWRQRLARIVVIRLGYMPNGRESPALARPRGLSTEKILAEIVPRIAEEIAEMDELLTRCERELGSGRLLDHPFIGPLTAAEWKKFHLVHGIHHVKQIHRLRDATQKKNAMQKKGATQEKSSV